MSKRLLILSAVLFMALAGMAFAAVENIKVSGDINEEAVIRDLSLGGTTGADTLRDIPMDKESYLLSQIRLRFDADLTENVSGVVRIIDERMWGTGREIGGESFDNSLLAVDLGYIQLKEFLYQPLTVVVGRQNLRYGNALIVGDPTTNMATRSSNGSDLPFGDLSLKKSFDAARAIFDFSPWTIDAIYSKVNEPVFGGTYQHNNTDLWGVNANYQWGSFNGVSEAYYFGAQNNRYGNLYTKVQTQVPENQDITNVVGLRTQFNPIEKMTLGLEGAYQFGDVQVPFDYAGNSVAAPAKHLSAYAIEAMAEYRFMTKYNPKLGLTYVYLSGNDDVNDHNYSGWDPMFEDQSLGEITNLLFPNSNIQGARASASMMPREDITVGVSYSWLELAQKLTEASTYTPPMGWYDVNTYDIKSNEGYLGSEVDAYALYDYTEDVQLKVSGAWFMPGDFFASTNDDVAYSVRGGVNLNF